MSPKQEELDNIVKSMYEALESEDHLRSTLLVVCGDHGMNEGGNHGGSSIGETSSALVFISPKFKDTFEGRQCPTISDSDYRFFDFVEQLDIVPTLASFLGFPIPRNNLGVVIPTLLTVWPDPTDRLALLDQNAVQMSKVASLALGSEPPMEDTRAFFQSVLTNGTQAPDPVTESQAQKRESHGSIQQRIDTRVGLLRQAQTVLSGTATSYNVSHLQLGASSAGLLLLAALAVGVSTYRFSVSTTLWVCTLIFCQVFSMFSSSYVEEEQHVWYWLRTGWVVWLHISASRQCSGLQHLLLPTIMVSTRIQRRWNQTGQKHAGEPDIGRTYLGSQPISLFVLVAFSYLIVLRGLGSASLYPGRKPAHFLANIGVVFLAFGFKLAFTQMDAPELIPKFGLLPFRDMAMLPMASVVRTVFGFVAGVFMIAIARALLAKRTPAEISTSMTLPRPPLRQQAD